MGETKTSERVWRVFKQDIRGQTYNALRDERLVTDASFRGDLIQRTTSYRSNRRDGETVDSLLQEAENASRKARGDSGHPFDTWKRDMKIYYPNWNQFARTPSGDTIELHGTWAHVDYGVDLYSSQRAFDTALDLYAPVPVQRDIEYYGSKAIELTIPTKPAANLSLALGELLAGVPVAPLKVGESLALKNSKGIVQASGQDYLSIVFGIAPTVRDVQDICKAIFSSADIVRQYLRDSGNVVRRGRSFPVVTDTKSVKANFWTAGKARSRDFDRFVRDAGGTAWQPDYEGTTTTRRTDRYWFAGAYEYYLDPGSDLWTKVFAAEQLANKLIGTRLTVSNLYELMPFSWLLDWFVNIGTIVSNANALQSDDLVLRYGYLMNHSVHETIHEVPAWGISSSTLAPHRTLFRSERKSRTRANPYGFAKSPNSFSGQQWAILAALGMTKAPRRLFD